ncbi:hypothetical protein SGQ44_01465 [Flavobacterium sp. Fl-77]|uniref:DUF4199 domain-containing protein n=1 Tax=Flavobacterium flavipigmentatum TaxID=2893884 RepID=A0AAJ2SDL8_9FLAO|nr:MULTISPECIES: hypothetical protein [unclassified Flavobacterium]MDX6180804.1 hypothetical protein [Flavobacterium sp. Fl-33]MDX6184404.1 hypothetical protein [Flavobacterium sp. Fl-77]UFH39513.1 hypothetical protein LNP22_04360 [Flavobacterium sp. F-70]
MKLPKEILNGFLIFLGIGLYFLLMNVLGLADLFYLRTLNVFFIFWGVNKTLQMNLLEGETNFVSNAVSAMATSVVGVSMSVFGLLIYSYARGGDAYVKSLSETFLFGGDPSVTAYCICLFFEGIASSVIVTMMLMLYWNNKYAAD